MFELYRKSQNCCGCTACMSICPTNAINMEPDFEGFLYPHIDSIKCIECGLCQQVCAFQNGYEVTTNYCKPIAYAVKHLSDDVRSNSTSGGMFTALSDEIIARNGVIYGASLSDDFVVCHQRAFNSIDRDAFRGSKYVQSEMCRIFSDLESDLEAGGFVLFTGTPCQVAAIKKYLITRCVKTDKLILCDIICHGVTSPLMFSEYLKLCSAKADTEISNHIFRSKISGWHHHTEVNIFKDGHVDHISYYSQLYKKMFYSHLILRPACHNCKYTNINRPSDITLADFWGIDKYMPDFDDDKGISLVLLNTQKGSNLFNSVKTHVTYFESNIDDCMQINLKEPSKPSPVRAAFWADYTQNNFEYVMTKYFGYGLKGDFFRYLSTLLKKVKLHAVIKRISRRHMP